MEAKILFFSCIKALLLTNIDVDYHTIKFIRQNRANRGNAVSDSNAYYT